MRNKKGNLSSNFQGLLQIKSYHNDLNPAEKKVAEYVIDNWQEVIYTSITSLARKVKVSEATIVKFCRSVGFSGYQDLKISLAQGNFREEQKDKIYGEISPEDQPSEVKEKIFQKYRESLNNTSQLIDLDKISQAARMLLKAERLYFFGFGASALVARDAEMKFARIGRPVQAVDRSHDQKMIAANLTAEDLVIAISDSGRTRELIETIDVLLETNCPVMAITSQAGSTLAERADLVLLSFSPETPFRSSAMASRFSQLAVVDMLFLMSALENYEETSEALRLTRKAIKSSKI